VGREGEGTGRRGRDGWGEGRGGGGWVLTGGGGYALVQVVPRTWTHLLAVASGRPLDPAAATPEPWRDYARARTGARPPETMTDGATASFAPFSSGYDPAGTGDRAIMATPHAGLPPHGLLPTP